MAPGMRGLTAGERAEAEAIYPGPVPYGRVRLCDGAGGNAVAAIAFGTGAWAITLRRTIYFGSHYSADFAAADPVHRELFFHEMTHVWQYSTLGVPRFALRYAGNFLSSGLNRDRMYRYEAGRPFARARLEAQAQMVGNYHRALADGNEPLIRLLEDSLSGGDLFGL